MNHVYDLATIQLDQPSVVTIGVFDGVHRGHQHLIQRLVRSARESGRLAVVLTFFPHPDVVLRGLTGRYYLTSPQQRAELMGELGVDHVITLPFNEEFRQIRAAAFVDLMREHLKLESLWVGADFALGYKREGTVEFLRAQGAAKGFTLEAIDLIGEDGSATFSSTAIRDALNAGDLEAARRLLGRSYSVSGEVVHGDHRGRTIGFPTANIAVWSEQLVPANGVYAGWATVGGEHYMAVTNVGLRPTFEGDSLRVEAHLLDFNREIYGETMNFSFETRLRPEKKFNGIQELMTQIALDAQAGRDYLTANPHP
ncbi:MAG: bifunctional riboflavin kinase/FAD synthetase [Chloroflexi bacterium]|uniref:bifunctional riboflavin kinase/FAD synthetase n=1 Tax=Candidatus Flexifilum breve TaxID=3140694 RepID=UPI003135B839|nr:bifunctional riboflavin kinase/FAD synthetase [Chloroflexota bacterium]